MEQPITARDGSPVAGDVGLPPPPDVAVRALPPGTSTVVLVEGVSDQLALERLANRCGRDLRAAGTVIVPMGGASSIGAALEVFGPHGIGLTLAGLCDAREAAAFRRGAERAGLGSAATDEDLARLGFFVCHADLEDELIRACGTSAVEQVVAACGELRALRTFQRQPAHVGRPLAAQLRRFLGTKGGRKVRYAPLLVDALDSHRVPAPLARVIDRVAP